MILSCCTVQLYTYQEFCITDVIYYIFINRQFSSALNPKQALDENPSVEDKKLNDIFKLELVDDKDADEIQVIWEEYYKNKEVISATIPKDLYNIIQQNMKKYPTFLFPLPRSEGYEFIMCQSFGNTVHFTPLLAFQVSHMFLNNKL